MQCVLSPEASPMLFYHHYESFSKWLLLWEASWLPRPDHDLLLWSSLVRTQII